MNAADELCQQYLNIVYHNVQSHHAKHHIMETSGEILYSGINKLLNITTFTDQDVFVDLGSGVGKIVLQVFLNSPVKKAYGIEIVEESHLRALTAAQKVQTDLIDIDQRELHFICGDFLKTSLEDTTIALINSTCLNQDVICKLGKVLSDTQSIHTVFTLRPMPTLKRLKFKKTIRIECSWDTVLCYMYN